MKSIKRNLENNLKSITLAATIFLLTDFLSYRLENKIL